MDNIDPTLNRAATTPCPCCVQVVAPALCAAMAPTIMRHAAPAEADGSGTPGGPIAEFNLHDGPARPALNARDADRSLVKRRSMRTVVQ